ncbi:SOS-response transcriptional repressors (RecA-mediated autopeptidases) [gamma proteobacterium HdN1]|nr:SOS-response transcriptional repressors (RecA-mediated autopeptidases) [gamma proteobacterium HdN1]
MEKLTARQSEILNYIRTHIGETGYPPTRMDIAQTFGFRSPNAAEEHLRALARKGAIRMTPSASRGIQLVDDEAQAAGVPIIGEVAAGFPVLAVENIRGYCAVPAELFTPRADFFLRVKGLSMKDAGILDGDLLAVHKTLEASNGQIVVARIGDEVTVKRLQKRNNAIVLLPENPDFAEIKIPPHDESFAIEGIAVGVLRNGGL